jgi:Protein of unknown function (DUF2281)
MLVALKKMINFTENRKTMGTDVLEKFKQLPPDKQQEAEDFISFLIEKYRIDPSENIGEKRKKNAGWAKGKIWMSDDFNETPEGFQEYI